MPPPAENADSASDPPLLTCEEAIAVAKVGGLMAESWTILALWEERTDGRGRGRSQSLLRIVRGAGQVRKT